MTNEKSKVSVIITAGGYGKRMGQPKQFLKLLGKPMVLWTIEAFKKSKYIDEIILVVAKEYLNEAKDFGVTITEGGAERTDSVRKGLSLVSKDSDIVLIHDGARPLVTQKIIEDSIAEAQRTGAAVVGVPVKDTIKQTNVEYRISNIDYQISKTLDRATLWQAQTPQAFKKEIIMRAYESTDDIATDDSKLVEDLGIPVKMVMGSYDNIKVTTPDDLIVADAILRSRNV